MVYEDNILIRFHKAVYNMLDGPVTFFREKIVEPNQKKYPWYHEKFRRVPTIDQCYTDDLACLIEADFQYQRDKLVDSHILAILKGRVEHCCVYYGFDDRDKYCTELQKIYDENATNWFIKYGDLHAFSDVKDAYMKQKHRMVWERRHGPVGSGMKGQEYSID